MTQAMGEGAGMRPGTDTAGDSTCCRNPVAVALFLALAFYRIRGETNNAGNPRLAFEGAVAPEERPEGR
jgi:hypothetical protein